MHDCGIGKKRKKVELAFAAGASPVDRPFVTLTGKKEKKKKGGGGEEGGPS